MIGEESALDGAEQAAAPGVAHIDSGAAWRDEEVVETASSQDSIVDLCSFFSQFHPALQTIFSVRFLASHSESRGVYFFVVWVFGCCLSCVSPKFLLDVIHVLAFVAC